MTAMFLERFERQRLLEEARFKESARRSRVMLIALLPIGAAVAMVVQYLEIPIVLERADPYHYILERPPIDVYLRLVAPALLAGLIGTTLVTGVFTRLTEAAGSLWRLLTIGFFFGVLMPAIKGLLLPLNFFLLNIAGLSNVADESSLQQQIGEVLFSTHISAFLTFLFGIKEGILAGITMAGLAWLIFRVAGPLSDRRRAWSIYTASFALSGVIIGLVIAGPFPILEFLFDHYPR